ncbi:MAG TPA: phytoene/squalene synthase family protein [Ignavibacteriales bacterium]|jgi:phytoene synthase|nr:phytoene/squalene synthase family protein [Ignavibacteriales bacterium]
MDINNENISNQKSNFKITFSLLPPEQKEAMHTLYQFCRITDDIVDDEKSSKDDKYSKILIWRSQVEKAIYHNSSDYFLLNKFAAIANRFNIPFEPIFDLIDGMIMDLEKNRYSTFDELLQYCYRVASTVGIMTIQIFGYKNPASKQYAVNLGYALQLTNIIRDVPEDASNNRIYLPINDLSKFNVTENDILLGNYNVNMKNLLKYEANIAKEYYKLADSYLDPEDRKLLYIARAMQHIYFALLKKIEKLGYNVFEKRISVPIYEKLYYTFGSYFKYNVLY